MAVPDPQDDHFRQGQGDPKTAEHRQYDPLALRTKHALTDEVKDRPLGRVPKDCGVEEAVYGYGSTA